MSRFRPTQFQQQQQPFRRPSPYQTGRQTFRAPPKPQPTPADQKKPPGEKTREVLRHVFQGNLSGSKQISISLDPAVDFEPVVTISKTGFPGIKLDTQAFFELFNNSEFISNYFDGQMSDSGQMQLSHAITLGFQRSYGRPVIKLIYAAHSPEEKFVTLAQETWVYLREMVPLLQHIHKQLSEQTPLVNDFFMDVIRYIRENLITERTGLQLCEVEDFLKTVSPEAISTEQSTLDKTRVFYELRQFCIFDIAGAIHNTAFMI